MKKHITNAAYGVLDYAAYPFGMLLVAPIVLHRLGAAEYGIWAIATAVISVGGIIASGFCDANIQRVAKLRGTGEPAAMVYTVRSILGINIVLGLLLACIAWIAAPFAAPRIAVAHPYLAPECVTALRIASALILVRAIESVTVSTQRAFEEYRGTVQINTAVRLLTLGTAALLALSGRHIVSILVATGIFLMLGTWMQFLQLRKYLGVIPALPAFHPEETRTLLHFGIFSWLQSLGSVILGQLDRLLLGVSLGAVAVAPYALCVQFSQPVSGLTASGLQFLFPYLSRRVGNVSRSELIKTLIKAFLCNLALVACGAAMLLIFGPHLLRAWAGAAVGRSASAILPPIVIGASLMGLSVTATYALLAHGMFRTVAAFSLSSRAVMLGLMMYLLHGHGLPGLAYSRLCYGMFALLLYVPLLRKLEIGNAAGRGRTLLETKIKSAVQGEPLL